ncbi:hypothetical protein ACFY2R_20870 [Micromonospora olivasterospora]|uniref:hypothetical protein n=1 Tax=Micromonospora olivasterospora TaxID=1880 RepID=UPI001B86F9D7|nr:hypothetical protein [Micromonospora olivasterospora]
MAFADQAGAEGVAQDVAAGEVGGDAGFVGDGEQDVVGTAVGERVGVNTEETGIILVPDMSGGQRGWFARG